jgi:hypothetical protein
MKIKVIIPLAIFVLLGSCKSQGKRIDDLIDRLDTADFSKLKTLTIYLRSSGVERNTSVYFVYRSNNDCPPYAVDVDDNKNIIQIRNDLVILRCAHDYLTHGEIEMVIKRYMEFKVNLLDVDSSGNVYINPGRSEKPTLLRRSPGSTPKDIAQFRLYKGNWYVREEK